MKRALCFALASALLALGLAGCGVPAQSDVPVASAAPAAEETPRAETPLPAESPASTMSSPAAEDAAAQPFSTEDFLSSADNVDQLENYLRVLSSYVYEPCKASELASNQIIDPAIFMCGRHSEALHDENGVLVLKEQDVAAWAEHLFGRSLDFDQLDEAYGYGFFKNYNGDDHTITARAFTDQVAVRGYGIDADHLDFQTEGQSLYVIAPILEIEDRGIWEPYQTLRYEFLLQQTEAGIPYCQLQTVSLYSGESAVPGLTEERLDELCQTGYLFFRHCQYGQEGLLPFDSEDQFVQGDQQYLAVASFDSEEEFLAFCQNYYTDSFIEENILPWFDSPEPTFLEKDDRLYYRTPSGTGIASPLAIQNAVIEPQGNDTLIVTIPLWDPQIEICLDATVEITLVYDGDAWKISEMQEFWN